MRMGKGMNKYQVLLFKSNIAREPAFKSRFVDTKKDANALVKRSMEWALPGTMFTAQKIILTENNVPIGTWISKGLGEYIEVSSS